MFDDKKSKENKSKGIVQLVEQPNESPLPDIGSLIKGLTFSFPTKPKYNTTNFDLQDELSIISVDDETIIDVETENKISELKEITNGIESKLIDTTHIPFNKTYKIDYFNELNKQQLAAVRVCAYGSSVGK